LNINVDALILNASIRCDAAAGKMTDFPPLKKIDYVVS